MPGTIDRIARCKWPEVAGETDPDLKRSFVLDAEVLRRAILDAVWRIAEDGVTRDCLGKGAVSVTKFAVAISSVLGVQDGAITTLKFADGAFTADATGRGKMADGFLTAAKFAAGTITTTELESALGVYAIPAGLMGWFAGETCPAGWLVCDGGERKVADFPALAAVCGTRWGTAPSGPLWFRLPDDRGVFARGWNHGRATGGDPDAATRTGGDAVASTQGGAVKAHVHTFPVVAHTYASGKTAPPPAAINYRTPSQLYAYDHQLSSYGGGETRPANVALMKIIKT